MSEQHDPLAAEQLTGEPDAAAAPVDLGTEPQVVAGQPVVAEPMDDEQETDAPRRRHRFLLMNAVPSWLISLLVHTTILIVLGYIDDLLHFLRSITLWRPQGQGSRRS